MAKPGKNQKAVVAEAPVEETVVEETVAPEEATVETPVEEAPVEAPVVTNVVADIIASPEAVPGPELKMEIPPTIAEQAVAIEEADNVEIVGIKGFEGISGRVAEVRPDGYIVIRATSGTFAAPKANVVKVK